MAGRSPHRFGNGVLQIQHGFLGELGRGDGVRRILSLTGVHGHVAASLLAEMQDVQGSACFENRETKFRYSRCIRHGGVQAPVLRRRENVLWKSRGKVEGQRMGYYLRKEYHNQYVLLGMWEENCWLFCDEKERLVSTVNNVEELLDLDMEPKAEYGGRARIRPRRK